MVTHIRMVHVQTKATVTEATDDGSKQGIIIVLNKSLYIHTYSKYKMTNMGLCMLVIRPYYLEMLSSFELSGVGVAIW